MTSTPYKDAAFKYLTHGWKGPLPVGNQPRQKTHPPAGYTGNDGSWPTEDQIAAWTEERPNVNIALRLPEHVIGIDVDDYSDKPGADTMIATTEKHGKLPRTWVSTSREGRSGIRWFRLPEPGVLPGKLVHPDDPSISGVEIIQHTHRYAIVPPSVHPEGRPYRWIKPDGTTVTDGAVPRPADFPVIPQAWIDHIRQDCSCWAPFDWNRYQETPGNDPVEAAYRKWAGRMTETYGRHDAALGGVMALIAFKERGWPGADHYLEQLQADFYRSLGDSRSQSEAEAEWQRMVEGAEKKAATTRIPQWQPQQTRHTPETFDERVEEELQRLLVRDAAQRRFRQETRPPAPLPPILTLRERLARPQPPIEWRIEGWQPAGTRVLLAAQYKAGKTTLTGNLTRCLVDNQPWLGVANIQPVAGHVTILDFEMSERQLDSWLGDQGIERDDKVVVIPMRGKASGFDILDDTVRKEWASRLAGTEYLILDCLRPILDALGLDEHHEAGRFLTAFDALCDEAGIDDALVVHHMGHQGERSRGDSRLRDWPDVEWRLVREDDNPASPRYISAYGRDVEQPEGRLEYHPDSRHLILVGGTRASAPVRAALEDILELLAEDPDRQWSKNAIVAELSRTTSHGRNDIRRAIDLGVENGQIHREIGPRNSQLHSHRASAPHRATTAPAQSLTTAPVPIGHGAVVNPKKPPSTAPTAPTPQSVCEVCNNPGNLIELRGELMHLRCAPRGWNPTPEEIAP